MDQKRYIKAKLASKKRGEALTRHERTLRELLKMQQNTTSRSEEESQEENSIASEQHFEQQCIKEEPFDEQNFDEQLFDPDRYEQDPSGCPSALDNYAAATSQQHLQSNYQMETAQQSADIEEQDDFKSKRLKLQENMCLRIAELSTSVENQSYQMQSNFQRLFESLESMNNLKKIEIAEMERHNVAMERLRQQEVNMKIETIKLLRRPSAANHS